MTRPEAYAKVKELNLQDHIKKTFGKNFTQVSTDNLEAAIRDCINQKSKPDMDDANEDDDIMEQGECTVDNVFEAACLAFLGILKDNDALDGLLAKL